MDGCLLTAGRNHLMERRTDGAYAAIGRKMDTDVWMFGKSLFVVADPMPTSSMKPPP